jgi:hypothetical protein
MPLVGILLNVNHVLTLSNPLPSYRGAGPQLTKLFVANWWLVMGTSLGKNCDRHRTAAHLAVVVVVSAEFPAIIRATHSSRPGRVCSQSSTEL